jgi:septal ring factor EnvC (AmiA/AmiB activator)
MKFTLFFALALRAAQCINQYESAAANPIRKVVTMLQKMQKKVQQEGEKEKELYEKYKCYCSTSGGNLQKSIAEANTKMPQLASDIKEAENQKVQLEADIKQAQSDRAAAKAAMADATKLREKEAAAYAAEKTELTTNLAALTKAISALEKGMAGSFLQTPTASAVRKMALDSQELIDVDRQDLLSFLSGAQSADYAPKGGEIVGILKEMKDTMAKDLASATSSEESAIKSYEELMAAKTKEVNALTSAIETKTTRVGQLGVDIVQMQEDLSDTEAALMEDTKFLADLEKNCETKTKEWEEICKTRADELVALAETIKILNDDDALELFKKTLPSASASFVQMAGSSNSVRARALSVLHGSHVELIMLSLRGKKVSFEKVIKMIDDMVALLKQEQVDDESKKEYCSIQFDQFDDKKKDLEHKSSDLETSIEDAQGAIATLKSEIKELEAGISALDKSVVEATEQRKLEHEDYLELMASDAAAKDLLGFAKNRLNKFYNPKLYKAPPKRELAEDERITVNMGGTLAPTAAPGGIAGTGVAVFAQVSEHVQKDAPPPPPETFGAYSKKSEETTGVIAMIDLLIKDLEKEMTEAKTTETDAQSDYEKAMADAAKKRTTDSKSLAAKTSAAADTEANLESYKQEKTATTKELAATLKVIQSLHAECDWLLQYFDVRKEARSAEIDSLEKAKAILSGADFSLMQAGSQNLRGKA